MADNVNSRTPFPRLLGSSRGAPAILSTTTAHGQMPFVHSWFLFLAQILIQSMSKYAGLGVVASGIPGAPPPTVKSKIRLTLQFCSSSGVDCARFSLLSRKYEMVEFVKCIPQVCQLRLRSPAP